MGGLNYCLLVGRIADHPRVSKSGQGYVANIRLAITDGPVVEYHTVVRFSPNEDWLRSFEYNQEICVEGQLQSRHYEDSNGTVQWITEIKAQKIEKIS